MNLLNDACTKYRRARYHRDVTVVQDNTHFTRVMESPSRTKRFAVETTLAGCRERKNVLMIHTGGTIGMWKNPETGYLEPKAGWLESMLETMPEMNDSSMPKYKLKEYWPLVDSSNMIPSDWVRRT